MSIFGEEKQIIFQKDIRRKIEIHLDQIIVYSPNGKFSEILEKGLKDYAYAFFWDVCHDLALQLDISLNRISIKDTKTRWGSCSCKGNLCFSWRLIFAPKKIAFYLAAHEVAHLKHMNHSKFFWKVVASLDPNYQESRIWLRNHGHNLLKITI